MRLIQAFALLLFFPGCTSTEHYYPSKPILLDVESYSFADFCQEFDKTYKAGTEEYERRQQIFETNLETIVAHNTNSQEGGGGHVLGINLFADMLPDELPRGYNKMLSSRRRYPAFSSTARRRRLHDDEEQQQQEEDSHDLPFMIEPESSLPPAVDWRTQGVTTPVKSQGACGSCWAFASTAVLESHIAIQTGTLFSLSEQELVSCAQNPRHCGGTGGCAGSTAEIAFELVMQKGIVQEWDFGYQSYHAEHVECTLKEKTNPPISGGVRGGVVNKEQFLSRTNSTLYKGAVASIDGYITLPSNKYLVLMNAVAKLGPVAVSVACLPWHLYQGGVFYAPLNNTRATDVGMSLLPVVLYHLLAKVVSMFTYSVHHLLFALYSDHLVVLEGYGTDETTGEPFWLVRNSWGPLWGENGYVRLLRVGEDHCGMDRTPSHGVSCTIDENGNEIAPPAAEICGNSGILYDTSVPLGGHLV